MTKSAKELVQVNTSYFGYVLAKYQGESILWICVHLVHTEEQTFINIELFFLVGVRKLNKL